MIKNDCRESICPKVVLRNYSRTCGLPFFNCAFEVFTNATVAPFYPPNHDRTPFCPKTVNTFLPSNDGHMIFDLNLSGPEPTWFTVLRGKPHGFSSQKINGADENQVLPQVLISMLSQSKIKEGHAGPIRNAASRFDPKLFQSTQNKLYGRLMDDGV